MRPTVRFDGSHDRSAGYLKVCNNRLKKWKSRDRMIPALFYFEDGGLSAPQTPEDLSPFGNSSGEHDHRVFKIILDRRQKLRAQSTVNDAVVD